MTKLLIVDDEPYTVEMLETFLQLNGFETIGALNGEDGLVLVKVERPELLILDLMLPDMEGFEVCRRIRSYADSATLPVLILSARGDAEAKERALSAGANAYLVKPARFPVLLETLKHLLEAPVVPVKPADTPVTAAPPTIPAADGPSATTNPVPVADVPGDTPRLASPESSQPKPDPA